MLDLESPIPLYFQLQEILRKKILDGGYQPGDLIPSEKELQEQYGISRMTVRNAINGLVFEDLLIKKQGRGTLVAFPRITEDGNSKLQSFTEKMEQQGAIILTEVIDIMKIPASMRIAEHLNIKPGEDLIYSKRLRKMDGTPIALFENYICKSTGITEKDDLSTSIYDIFEKKYKIIISGADKVIEADTARSEDAALLNIPEGDPILIIRNTTFDSNNRPIEYAEGIYRADLYKYTVKLKR